MSSSTEITVYRPNMRHELGWFRTWAVMVQNIYGARDLIWQLFKRDLTAGYKKSFMGFAWFFISPIMGIVTWVFLQKSGMLRPGDVGIPYPAYVLIGTSMWGLFMGFYGAGSGTLGAGSDLIQQVNYPHEAMLFKNTASQVVHFSFTFVLNIIVLLMFGVVPSWGTVLLPLVALPLFLLAAGFGLVMAMVKVVATDLDRVVSYAFRLLMFATPVVYSATDIGNEYVRLVVKWNPLTYLVCSCRDIIVYGRLYGAGGYAISATLGVAIFLVAWRLFYVSEHQLVERMV